MKFIFLSAILYIFVDTLWGYEEAAIVSELLPAPSPLRTLLLQKRTLDAEKNSPDEEDAEGSGHQNEEETTTPPQDLELKHKEEPDIPADVEEGLNLKNKEAPQVEEGHELKNKEESHTEEYDTQYNAEGKKLKDKEELYGPQWVAENGDAISYDQPQNRDTIEMTTRETDHILYVERKEPMLIEHATPRIDNPNDIALWNVKPSGLLATAINAANTLRRISKMLTLGLRALVEI